MISSLALVSSIAPLQPLKLTVEPMVRLPFPQFFSVRGISITMPGAIVTDGWVGLKGGTDCSSCYGTSFGCAQDVHSPLLFLRILINQHEAKWAIRTSSDCDGNCERDSLDGQQPRYFYDGGYFNSAGISYFSNLLFLTLKMAIPLLLDATTTLPRMLPAISSKSGLIAHLATSARPLTRLAMCLSSPTFVSWPRRSLLPALASARNPLTLSSVRRDVVFQPALTFSPRPW